MNNSKFSVRVIDEQHEVNLWNLESKIYRIRVEESTIRNTFLTTVRSAKSCPMPYFSTNSNIITIDERTGNIYLAKELDFEYEKLLSVGIRIMNDFPKTIQAE